MKILKVYIKPVFSLVDIKYEYDIAGGGAYAGAPTSVKSNNDFGDVTDSGSNDGDAAAYRSGIWDSDELFPNM